jgi:hypothetical protein
MPRVPKVCPSLSPRQMTELRLQPWTDVEVDLLLERLDGTGWQLLSRFGTPFCADFRNGRWRVCLGGYVADVDEVRAAYLVRRSRRIEPRLAMSRFRSHALLLAASERPLTRERLRGIARSISVVLLPWHSVSRREGDGLPEAAMSLVRRGLLRRRRSSRGETEWELTDRGRRRVDRLVARMWRRLAGKETS